MEKHCKCPLFDTRNVAQYHLHNATYVPAKFALAIFNGLGILLQENTLFDFDFGKFGIFCSYLLASHVQLGQVRTFAVLALMFTEVVFHAVVIFVVSMPQFCV